MHPMELMLLDSSTGVISPLTALNAEWLAEIDLATAEPLVFPGSQGDQVHGWVMRPIDFGFKKNLSIPIIIYRNYAYTGTYMYRNIYRNIRSYTILFIRYTR